MKSRVESKISKYLLYKENRKSHNFVGYAPPQSIFNVLNSSVSKINSWNPKINTWVERIKHTFIIKDQKIEEKNKRKDSMSAENRWFVENIFNFSNVRLINLMKRVVFYQNLIYDHALDIVKRMVCGQLKFKYFKRIILVDYWNEVKTYSMFQIFICTVF